MHRLNRPILSGRVFLLVACGFLLRTVASADHFTYVTPEGKTVEVEARLAGSGQGVHVLELADGSLVLVPEAAVSKRTIGPDPEPESPEAVAAKLALHYGVDRFRSVVDERYVVGLVLSPPALSDAEERRTRSVLEKAAKFMQSVERTFLDFARRMHLETAEPRYPLVVLIFESDAEFERFASQSIRGKGLAAANVSGFYSPFTNQLSIRLSECRSFAVPLHEAIHQQVYNRQVVQRLAPVPVWFHEGLATGFEGDGDRIGVSPVKINTRYAGQVATAKRLDWQRLIVEDDLFSGSVLVGDAYTHAWSLHWLLVKKYPRQYGEYVRMLAAKQPLAEDNPEQRVRELEAAFGRSLAELEREFPTSLAVGLKQQKVTPADRLPPGQSRTESNLGEAWINVIERADGDGRLLVQGRLVNLSPIRPMAFYVTVETASGRYADWLVPKLELKQSVQLETQAVEKLAANASGGRADQYFVRIRSTPHDSEEARRWQQGKLPVPASR